MLLNLFLSSDGSLISDFCPDPLLAKARSIINAKNKDDIFFIPT
jgi:hypothetical protein